jgi:two-component system chemotaxis response regulator CheY
MGDGPISPGATDYGALAVLVVEDETVTRMAVVRMLRQIGVTRVIEASDGAEALARCDRLAFDLILCDIEMAPLDGLTFVESLRGRKNAPSRATAVIMLTKHATSQFVARARSQGANAYLVKPVTSPELKAKIDQILRP